MPDEKPDNVIKLYRELLNGTSPEEVALPTLQADADEYRKFCLYCNRVYSDPFFELLRKALVQVQVFKTALDSADYEQVSFGRATVHGIALWEEMFKFYSNEWDIKFSGKEENADFNSSRGFQSVDNN